MTLLSREIHRWRKAIAGNSAHDLRIACRRCREALRIQHQDVPALSRFSRSLGPLRDMEMLCDRLAKRRSSNTPCLFRHFEKKHTAMERAFRGRLRSPIVKYLRLRLTQIAKAPSDTPEGHPVLRKAYRRVKRLWKNHPREPDRAYLHPLRRAIRRLRFTSELVAPRHGEPLKKLTEETLHWQHLLGDYHDAVTAQRLLAPLHTHGGQDLSKEFHALEDQRKEEFWHAFRHGGWQKLRRKAKKALRVLKEES